MAVGGLGGGRTITSQSTNQRGLISAVDLAPTILRHLGLAIPDEMRGKPIELDGSFDGAYLRSFKGRLNVDLRPPAGSAGLSLRRLGAADARRACAAALLAPAHGRRASGAWRYCGRRWRCSSQRRFAPGRGVEDALLVLICFALGALTDRLLAWPRAPLAPAIVAVVALTADALAGTQLLARSLLGPNPELGVRFYGIGNELKSGLAVLVFAAVAAALYPAVRGRRAAHDDGRVRDRARGDRGLGADRGGRRRRDPRERWHGRRHRAAAARQARPAVAG